MLNTAYIHLIGNFRKTQSGYFLYRELLNAKQYIAASQPILGSLVNPQLMEFGLQRAYLRII